LAFILGLDVTARAQRRRLFATSQRGERIGRYLGCAASVGPPLADLLGIIQLPI
jgi:hypothetical protein